MAKNYDRNFLVVKNILRKYNSIMSAVQFQYGDTIVFDTDSDEYLSALSIDVIISSLLKEELLTEEDITIIDMFKDGYTYAEISERIGRSRQIVSKKLTESITKIAERFFSEESE